MISSYSNIPDLHVSKQHLLYLYIGWCSYIPLAIHILTKYFGDTNHIQIAAKFAALYAIEVFCMENLPLFLFDIYPKCFHNFERIDQQKPLKGLLLKHLQVLQTCDQFLLQSLGRLQPHLKLHPHYSCLCIWSP